MLVKAKKTKSKDSLVDSLNEVLEDVKGTKKLDSRSVEFKNLAYEPNSLSDAPQEAQQRAYSQGHGGQFRPYSA